MAEHRHAFLPALGLHSLTRFYDPVIRLTLREEEAKRRLIEQARISAGMDVLDFGCGTGTLILMLKRAHPDTRASGLDVDPEVLAIARDKLSRAGVDAALKEGSASAPPFPEASFDRVLTSLVLHHLTTAEKREALAGLRRLLRPGGELHVADFGPPQNALMWIVSRGVGLLAGSERTRVNLSGELPALVRECGFRDVEERGGMMTPFGTLAFFAAKV
jgi:ubiquinone/menaquinone biosynthesis C-methylase UbiE